MFLMQMPTALEMEGMDGLGIWLLQFENTPHSRRDFINKPVQNWFLI